MPVETLKLTTATYFDSSILCTQRCAVLVVCASLKQHVVATCVRMSTLLNNRLLLNRTIRSLRGIIPPCLNWMPLLVLLCLFALPRDLFFVVESRFVPCRSNTFDSASEPLGLSYLVIFYRLQCNNCVCRSLSAWTVEL
jgi:hypothetical protein